MERLRTNSGLFEDPMPIGAPTPEQLWNGEISFFSIDTDLIQAAGYNFTKGSLNQLPKQLPKSIKLKITEIVASEIIHHLIAPVVENSQKIQKSAADIQRLTTIEMGGVTSMVDSMGIESHARSLYRNKIEDYCGRCNGSILPIAGESLANVLFLMYFDQNPPFGIRKDKKNEFPDATSLILLENYAVETETKGIIASNDSGWAGYASTSSNLYYVRSIDELAKLFIATGEHGEEVKNLILEAVRDNKSIIREIINNALHLHVADSEWIVDDIYSNVSTRVDAEVYDATLEKYEIELDDINAWLNEEDPSAWTVELQVAARAALDIEITHSIWDFVDREEVELTAEPRRIEYGMEIAVYLSCKKVRKDVSPSEWEVTIEIAPGRYNVSIGEVDPFVDDPRWD